MYELLSAVLLTILDGFDTIRLIQIIFETNKLIISLLLLMCKHVSLLQIAQQDPNVQKRKKKELSCE